MNNAYVLNEPIEAPEKDIKPMLREKLEELVKTIEALQNIAGSEYWKVLQKEIFDVNFSKARSLLEKEEDTTELFRLQGEIRAMKKLDLEKTLQEKRAELKALRKKING